MKLTRRSFLKLPIVAFLSRLLPRLGPSNYAVPQPLPVAKLHPEVIRAYSADGEIQMGQIVFFDANTGKISARQGDEQIPIGIALNDSNDMGTVDIMISGIAAMYRDLHLRTSL